MGDLLVQLGGAGAVFALLAIVGLMIIVVRSYQKVERGKALIITGMNKDKVSFTGGVVWPIINRSDSVSLGSNSDRPLSPSPSKADDNHPEGLLCVSVAIRLRAFVKRPCPTRVGIHA